MLSVTYIAVNCTIAPDVLQGTVAFRSAAGIVLFQGGRRRQHDLGFFGSPTGVHKVQSHNGAQSAGPGIKSNMAQFSCHCRPPKTFCQERLGLVAAKKI